MFFKSDSTIANLIIMNKCGIVIDNMVPSEKTVKLSKNF